MEFLIPIFIVGFVMTLLGWIAYVILELVRTRHRIRATSELQAKLIDRLGAQDIGVFLTSDTGARLLRALSEQPASDGAHVRILRALQSGIVLLAVGAGLFAYLALRTLPLEGEDAVAFFATLTTAVGVGLLAAAGASYRMSRRMGLLNKRTEDTDPARAA
jgi:ABC-type multidrug transport system fused ATPase/permease subunit